MALMLEQSPQGRWQLNVDGSRISLVAEDFVALADFIRADDPETLPAAGEIRHWGLGFAGNVSEGMIRDIATAVPARSLAAFLVVMGNDAEVVERFRKALGIAGWTLAINEVEALASLLEGRVDRGHGRAGPMTGRFGPGSLMHEALRFKAAAEKRMTSPNPDAMALVNERLGKPPVRPALTLEEALGEGHGWVLILGDETLLVSDFDTRKLPDIFARLDAEEGRPPEALPEIRRWARQLLGIDGGIIARLCEKAGFEATAGFLIAVGDDKEVLTVVRKALGRKRFAEVMDIVREEVIQIDSAWTGAEFKSWNPGEGDYVKRLARSFVAATHKGVRDAPKHKPKSAKGKS